MFGAVAIEIAVENINCNNHDHIKSFSSTIGFNCYLSVLPSYSNYFVYSKCVVLFCFFVCLRCFFNDVFFGSIYYKTVNFLWYIWRLYSLTTYTSLWFLPSFSFLSQKNKYIYFLDFSFAWPIDQIHCVLSRMLLCCVHFYIDLLFPSLLSYQQQYIRRNLVIYIVGSLRTTNKKLTFEQCPKYT